MYIFLDIDGVLNTQNDWKHPYTINKTCFKNFIKTVKKCSNPKIILISSWRKGWFSNYEKCSPQVKDLIKQLNVYGLSINGKTIISEQKDRAYEINYFLQNHEKDKYIIFDDDLTEYKTSIKNLIKINSLQGFTGKEQ